MDRIISTSYDLLENIYHANINQDRKYKENALVNIQMLNFYLKQSFDKELVSNKKLLNYGRYLTELHNMINSWLDYEKAE